MTDEQETAFGKFLDWAGAAIVILVSAILCTMFITGWWMVYRLWMHS